MSTTSYDLGDKPRFTTTFAVNGTNTNPTAVVMIVKLPGGTRQSYLSGSGFSSQGNWSAATNTPSLADGTGTTGHFYTVSGAGTINLGSGSQTFANGDYVAYDGETWLLIHSPQSGTLTNSATGIFYYDLPLHNEGNYYVRFEGFGTVHAADEISFRVLNSSIR
jgi:hypothetical protein